MSCREHGGGRLATALARDASGLNDVQVLTTLHRLNREAAALPDLPQPTREEVSRWTARMVEEALAANPVMSESRQRKLQQWAEQIAQEELPSPALFYAWQNLQRETRQSHADLEMVVSRLAHLLGATPGEVRERAAQFAHQYTTSSKHHRRSLSEDRQLYRARLELINELEYTAHHSGVRQVSRRLKLPQDGASLYALGCLALQLDKSQYLRQALREAPDGSRITDVTYIPLTGQLAINFNNGHRHSIITTDTDLPKVELLREVVGSAKFKVLGQFKLHQRTLASQELQKLTQGQLVEHYTDRFGQGQGEAARVINQHEVRVVCEYLRPTTTTTNSDPTRTQSWLFVVDFGDGSNLLTVPSQYFNRHSTSGNETALAPLNPAQPQPQAEWPRLTVAPNLHQFNHFTLSRQLGRCPYCGQFTSQSQSQASQQGQEHTCCYTPTVKVELPRREATHLTPELNLYTFTGYNSVSGVAYDPTSRTLDVELYNRFCRYQDVPASVVQELLTNPNPAHYHAYTMQPRYHPQQISDFRQSLRAAAVAATEQNGNANTEVAGQTRPAPATTPSSASTSASFPAPNNATAPQANPNSQLAQPPPTPSLPTRYDFSRLYSGGLEGIAYDPATQTLDVEFYTTGAIYRYAGVPASLVEVFNRSARGGNAMSFYVQFIRDSYTSQQLTTASQSLRAPLPLGVVATANTSTPISTAATPLAPPNSGQTIQAQSSAAQILRASSLALVQSQEIARSQATHQSQSRQYTRDMAAFQRVYEEARAKKARGEAFLEFITENVTGGLGSPNREGGRPFGIEIEFDLDGVADKNAALAAIGRELYEEALTTNRFMETPASRRYPSWPLHNADYSRWQFVSDPSVDGEIVSPKMFDEPKRWEELAKVCEIVKRHGGRATTRTGGHVHVDCGDYGRDIRNHNRLLQAFDIHEDVLYRLAQNPAADRYRGFEWSRPNYTSAYEYESLTELQNRHSGKHVGLNFAHVHGVAKDHVEYRLWDGTLDPAVIQTQVALSLGLTHFALINRPNSPASIINTDPNNTGIGSHYSASLTPHRQPRPEPWQGNDWETHTLAVREMVDSLFNEDHLKERVISLFAVNKWVG